MMVCVCVAAFSASFGRSDILPFHHPAHQLTPILTLMHSSKSRHPTQGLILCFHGQVWRTHQGLPEEIYTVSHVHWRDFEGNVIDIERDG